MRFFSLILFYALSTGISAGVEVGDVSSTNGTATSFSFAHDVSGKDTMLIVGIGFRGGGGTTESSIEYNGVAMSKVGSTQTEGDINLVMYQLADPSDGTNNVTGDFSASENFVVGATTYTGVDSIGNTHGVTNAFESFLDLTITTSAVDSMLVGSTALERGTGTVTKFPEQTFRWNEAVGNAAGGALGEYGDRLVTAKQDYPFGYTYSVSDRNTLIVVELLEVVPPFLPTDTLRTKTGVR